MLHNHVIRQISIYLVQHGVQVTSCYVMTTFLIGRVRFPVLHREIGNLSNLAVGRRRW